MLPLSAIEQGIKDAVAALNRPYIAQIKTYGGEFDKELDQVIRRFPAVWTTFDGTGMPERQGARRYRVPLTFVVLVGARSVRNEEACRHGVEINGQQAEIGTFQLLADVSAALLDRDLGIEGLSRLRPGRIRTVFNTATKAEAVSVLAQLWHVDALVVMADADEATAQWLERVNVDYVAQPGDDGPDASDFFDKVGDGS